MNRELLSALTAAPATADALVAAARANARSRQQLRALGIAGAAVTAMAAAFLMLPSKPRAAAIVQAPPPSLMLSDNELLDSFGDQPVALVTWPDGRQQLLAIAGPGKGP